MKLISAKSLRELRKEHGSDFGRERRPRRDRGRGRRRSEERGGRKRLPRARGRRNERLDASSLSHSPEQASNRSERSERPQRRRGLLQRQAGLPARRGKQPVDPVALQRQSVPGAAQAYSPPARLGDHLLLQAQQGYRAAVIELRPGEHLDAAERRELETLWRDQGIDAPVEIVEFEGSLIPGPRIAQTVRALRSALERVQSESAP